MLLEDANDLVDFLVVSGQTMNPQTWCREYIDDALERQSRSIF
jgi:hypothetical protein